MTKQATDSRQVEVRMLLRDPLLTALSDFTGWALLVAFCAILIFSLMWVWGLMTSLSDAIPTSISASVDSVDCEAEQFSDPPESLAEKDPQGRLIRRSACKSASALSGSWQRQLDLYKYIGKSALTKEGGTVRAHSTLSFGQDKDASSSGIERF